MKVPKESQRSARKLFRFCMKDGRLDESRVREIAKALATEKPRHYIATLKYFRKLVELELDRHKVLIESAVELTQSQRDDIISSLGSHYGGGLVAETRTNPDLIGGIRVRIGNDVYDSSVQGRLNQIARSFS